MNQTVLGLPFFENNDIVIRPRTRTWKLPHKVSTDRPNPQRWKDKFSPSEKNRFLIATQYVTVSPSSSEVVVCSLDHVTFPEDTIDMVETNPKLRKKQAFLSPVQLSNLKKTKSLLRR